MSVERKIARLKSRVLTAQINVWIEEELKATFESLKAEHDVNVPEEIRMALRSLAEELQTRIKKETRLQTCS